MSNRRRSELSANGASAGCHVGCILFGRWMGVMALSLINCLRPIRML